MYLPHLVYPRRFFPVVLVGLCLTGLLVYSILMHPPLVTLGVLVALPMVLLTMVRPLFGLFLITLISPLNDLQRFSGELNVVRLVGLITIFSFLLRLFIKRASLRRTPLDIPILFLAFSYILPYFNAEWGWTNFSFLISLFSMFAFYFAAVNIVTKERDITWLLSGLFVSATILATLSLYSYLTGVHLFSFQDASSTGLLINKIRGETISQVTGSSTNPNEFAVLFILLLPFSLGRALHKERISQKVLHLGLTGLFALTLLATLSRSAILAAGFSSGFLLFRHFTSKRIGNLGLAVAIFLVSVSLWLLSFKVFTVIHENLITRVALTADYYEDKTIIDRFSLYPAAVRMTWDHPFGVGYGNFSKEIVDYHGAMRGAHNTILNVMGSNGFLGLTAILWFLYALFRSLWRAAHSQGPEKGNFLGVCFLGSFIAFWIHASFHSLLHWNMVWLFFAMAMANVRGTIHFNTRSHAPGKDSHDEVG